MTKQTKHPTRLVLNVIRPGQLTSYSDGYFHVNVSVVPDYAHSEMPYGLYDDCNGLRLTDLRFTTQGDNRSNKLYGYNVEYRDLHAVNLRQAQAMVKTMRTLENRMRKQADKFGYPGDCLQKQLLHFANAVGAKRFDILDRDSKRWGDRSHAVEGAIIADSNYRFYSVEAELCATHGKKEEAA